MVRLGGTKIRGLSNRPVFQLVGRLIPLLSIRLVISAMLGMRLEPQEPTGCSSSAKILYAKLCIHQRKSGRKSPTTSGALGVSHGMPYSAMASATPTQRRHASSSLTAQSRGLLPNGIRPQEPADVKWGPSSPHDLLIAAKRLLQSEI